MGKFEGKVVLVTGAARGQGRSHAVRFAEEGADVIAIDICEQIESVPFPMATPEDLEQTVAEVEALGRKAEARQVDVRDLPDLEAAVATAVAELGRLDVVIANAGIGVFGRADEIGTQRWNDVIDVNLTAVYHTATASLPHLRAGQRGGSIIITASAAGMRGGRNLAPYVSAKTGVLGLVRSLAIELAQDHIRVNAIAPGAVNTPMLHNDAMYRLFCPDLEAPTLGDVLPRFESVNLLPGVRWVEAVDISNAAVFLASDDGRYITGVTLPVDAGSLLT